MRSAQTPEDRRRDGSHCYYVPFARGRTYSTPPTRSSAISASAISPSPSRSSGETRTTASAASPTSTNTPRSITSSTGSTSPSTTTIGLPRRSCFSLRGWKSRDAMIQARVRQLGGDSGFHRHQQDPGRRGGPLPLHLPRHSRFSAGKPRHMQVTTLLSRRDATGKLVRTIKEGTNKKNSRPPSRSNNPNSVQSFRTPFPIQSAVL